MEVHQSLNETMRLFDESVEELFYLLTYFMGTCWCGCHGYRVNK